MEGRWWCFDATRRLNQFRRYMNHAPGSMANATPVPPVLLEGRLRVGFIATKHIQAGEEITWDYGVVVNLGCPDKVTPVLTLIPIKHVIYMSHPAVHLVSIIVINNHHHFLLGSTQQPIPTQDQGILSTSEVVNAPTTNPVDYCMYP